MALSLDAPDYFKFVVICEDGDEAWVKAINGVFKGERYTFKRKDLFEIGEEGTPNGNCLDSSSN